MSTSRTPLLLMIVGLGLGLGVGACAPKRDTLPSTPPTDDDMVACTQDAKICPGGSAVGREGPDCDFPPCPGEEPGS